MRLWWSIHPITRRPRKRCAWRTTVSARASNSRTFCAVTLLRGSETVVEKGNVHPTPGPLVVLADLTASGAFAGICADMDGEGGVNEAERDVIDNGVAKPDEGGANVVGQATYEANDRDLTKSWTIVRCSRAPGIARA